MKTKTFAIAITVLAAVVAVLAARGVHRRRRRFRGGLGLRNDGRALIEAPHGLPAQSS